METDTTNKRADMVANLILEVASNRAILDEMSKSIEKTASVLIKHNEKIELLFNQIEAIDKELATINRKIC